MWFGIKSDVAPLYKDETLRRAFATASGRPKGVKKLKKLKTEAEKEAEKARKKAKRKGLWRLFGRS